MDKGKACSIQNESRQWKVRIFVLLSILETAMFGGIPYGWGTLLYLLKEEGIYSDLCLRLNNSTLISNTTTGIKQLAEKSDLILSHSCTEQDQRFNLWFGIAGVCGVTSNVIIGKIIQLIGTSKARIVFM